jgi:TolA-binding protein
MRPVSALRVLLVGVVMASSASALAQDKQKDKQKARPVAKDRAKEFEERQRKLDEDRARWEAEQERLEEERARLREQEEARREQERERIDQAREREAEARDREQEGREREQEARERQRDAVERGRHRGHGGEHRPLNLPTSVKVKGPVRFSIELVSADVEIQAVGKDLVSISAKNCKPGEMGLDVDGDEIEAAFAEWGDCEGPVLVKLPQGSSAEVATIDGGIRLRGVYKDVEAGAVAGDILVETAETAEIEAVQGNVRVVSVTRLDVESVSGNVDVTTVGFAPSVSIETVNGGVTWRGGCGKSCRMAVESFQGHVQLFFDPRSSFETRFESEGGKLDNQLGGAPSPPAGKNVRGKAPTRVKFGKGEGLVRVETYQGDLSLKKK